MSRNYHHCHNCAKRMRRIQFDKDGERRFYYCPKCYWTGIWFESINGWSIGWTAELLERAIDAGVLPLRSHVTPLELLNRRT